MKNFIHILIALFLLSTFNACEDKEMIVYDPADTVASQLTVPSSIALSLDNADSPVSFQWTKADYGLQVSVTYSLQMSASTDFTGAQTLFSGNALSFETTQGALNTRLLEKLGLEPETEATVYFRVVNSINTAVDNLASATQSATVTPYATVFPPIYMIGPAVGDWNTALAVEVPSSAPSIYTTIWKFTKDGAFRFFAQPDWNPTSYNYPYFATGTVSNLFENNNDGDSNFKFVGETGYYRVTVNLKTFTVQMESVPEPIMYMTGAGIGGWDTPGTGHSIKMTFVKENVWKATATFVSGDAWRFFAQADWNPTSYNFPYFAGGTVAGMFEEAADGDKNFKNKSGGTYVITLNLNDLSVAVAAP